MTADGPININQVVHAATGFGHVARCGCGWRAVHDSKIGAIVAGQRHVRAAHGAPVPESVNPPEGDAA